jgi:hypothetical protein
MPDESRTVAAATDGELWARRDVYAREAVWAPPYVVEELRDAHLAEDVYRADAVRAWQRADVATDESERAQAQQAAEESSALAQEVGAYRESLTEVAEARRHWHAATEPARQQALLADSELRRRYPDLELPPLHPREAPGDAERDAGPVRNESTADQAEPDQRPVDDRSGAVRDVTAALAAARKAERILAERGQPGLDSDDLMHRQEAEARREAAARRSAVRQEPAPSRRTVSLEQEPELEAGH